jgi:hypothetical protein
LEIGNANADLLNWLLQETRGGTMKVFARTIKSPLSRTLAGTLIATVVALSSLTTGTSAQKGRRPVKHLSVCGNPKATCKTIATFEPYDLPFRLPENAVIYDTELFYAIILKSVSARNDNCGVFVRENERLATQGLFPDNKVFSSRCAEPGGLSYTNTNPNQHFMAVYAGMTTTDANRMLAAVKATGKFPGASIRRMRAAFNGT